MRPFSLALFALALACAGGNDTPPAAPDAAPGAAPTASPANPAAPAGAAAATAPADPLAAVGSDADAALADHYLVILGSKPDPAEVIPGVATVAAHPELGAQVRQVLSSRFKSLMPCYAVTIAGASPDRKAALALSKQLTALGVDNYVKNAGAWVGRSAAIDAYCAAGDAPVAEEIRVAHLLDGALWVPVPAGEAEIAALAAKAPPPVAKSERYDAWIQPAGAAEAASWRLVDATTGRTRTCSTAEAALLTLGTPHFGVLQGEGPPEAPACGAPALYHRLACDGPVDTGSWVAVPAEAALAPYEPLGAVGGPLLEAATAAIVARTDYEADPESYDPAEGPIEREVVATRWKGPAGEVLVVQARRLSGNGVCGGAEPVWFGVFGVNGDTLGAALGALHAADFARVAGLVDVGADGRPDVVVTSFPETTTVWGGDGNPAATLTIDYCDCAC